MKNCNNSARGVLNMKCNRVGNGFICSHKIKIYKYKGVIFEFGRHGPYQLTKDHEIINNRSDKFWNMYSKFEKLSEIKKASYEI